MKKIDIAIENEKVSVTASIDNIMVFSGNGWINPGMTGGFIRTNTKAHAMRARNLESGMYRMIRMALLELNKEG